MTVQHDWWSPDGAENGRLIRVQHADAFSALSELDALGHRILFRLGSQGTSRLDFLVGAMLLRRAVTQFVGIRHLLWDSAVDPAKLLARALFETLLTTRYFVHGGRRDLDLNTPSNARNREIRARYFLVGSIRNEVYQRQAILDRVWSAKRVRESVRQGIQSEIDERIATLNKEFPVQQRKFGPFAFERIPKKRQYHDELKWYSYGFRRTKPKSIQRLADRLGWLPIYWMLYKPFSEMNHPVNLAHDVQIEGGHADILHPYIAEDLDAVVYWASSWQSLILIYMAKAFHPASIPDVQRIDQRVKSLTADLHPGLIGFA